jgi:hypothetical protein
MAASPEDVEIVNAKEQWRVAQKAWGDALVAEGTQNGKATARWGELINEVNISPEHLQLKRAAEAARDKFHGLDGTADQPFPGKAAPAKPPAKGQGRKSRRHRRKSKKSKKSRRR